MGQVVPDQEEMIALEQERSRAETERKRLNGRRREIDLQGPDDH